MNIKELYEVTGGGYDEAIGRLMNEKLMDKFVRKFAQDPSFNSLVESLENNDMETAFRAAHTLKGTAMNLGLKTLANTASNLTEALRPGNDLPSKEEITNMLSEVKDSYTTAIKAIEDLEPLA